MPGLVNHANAVGFSYGSPLGHYGKESIAVFYQRLQGVAGEDLVGYQRTAVLCHAVHGGFLPSSLAGPCFDELGGGGRGAVSLKPGGHIASEAKLDAVGI